MNYHCETCDFHSSNKNDYNRHCMTAKHKKCLLNVKNAEKTRMKFHCEYCDFYTSNKTNYTQHEMTVKHKKCILGDKNAEKSRDESSCVIDIVKQVLLSQGKQQELMNKHLELTNKQLELTNKQQQQQQQQQHTNITNQTNNNYNTNNNNQFNLQLFLNDTCKNASNFTEFIDNIRVSFEDIKNNGQQGFVNGISKIIVDNLKQLELENRPIHCTDVKRETFYVKEENQWETENSKRIIEKGVNEVKRKGMITLNEWRDETPERYEENHPAEQLEYQMQGELTPSNNMDKLFPKVLNILAKETKLEKNNTIVI